jgi:hypothetical protein
VAWTANTLVIFSNFSPSTTGSHFQRTCGEKLKLLHFSKNCWTTGGKFAVAGQQIAGASENFVLNY